MRSILRDLYWGLDLPSHSTGCHNTESFQDAMPAKVRIKLYISYSTSYKSLYFKPPSPTEIKDASCDSIRYMLQKCHKELKQWGQRPYTEQKLPQEYKILSNIVARKLEAPWANVIQVARNFNYLRSYQLNRMAYLFDAHRTTLKKASDPAQKPPSNIDHIIRRLRSEDRRMTETHPLRCFRRSKQHFEHDLFPNVPLASCLRIFVGILGRYF